MSIVLKPNSALLIVGHGSTQNPDSSTPYCEHAEEVRRRGVFAEVHCCFWKEEPSLRDAFYLFDAEEIYVVPDFISEGYFTQDVIPRELGLSGPTTVIGGSLLVSGALGATAVEVLAGATLAINGSLGGSLTLRSGGHLALAVAATPGAQTTRTIAGPLTFDEGSTLDLTAAVLPTVGTYVLATATGAITGTPTTVNHTGFAGAVTLSDHRLELTVKNGYASWAAAHGIAGEPATGDFDHDDLSNLLEYALGLDPAVTNGSPGTLVGTLLSFAKTAEAVANGDVTYAIEESDDLGQTDPWHVVTPTTDNATTISFQLPPGKPRTFARPVVTQKP